MMADSKAKNASPGPPTWEYTGYGGVDETLSLLINFFLQSFDGGRFVMMPEFIASVGPAAILPIIEMRRSGYHTATVFVSMLVLGFIYQNFGAGRATPLQPQYAKATLVGYFLGFVAVSMAMIVYQTPGIIAIWQFFPGYILLVQVLSLGAQLPLDVGGGASSYDILLVIHTFNFGWSAVTHAYTLFRAFSSSAPLDSLKDSYLPNYSSASVGLAPAASQAFCKWDLVYIAAATSFAGLWLLRGTQQRLLALGGHPQTPGKNLLVSPLAVETVEAEVEDKLLPAQKIQAKALRWLWRLQTVVHQAAAGIEEANARNGLRRSLGALVPTHGGDAVVVEGLEVLPRVVRSLHAEDVARISAHDSPMEAAKPARQQTNPFLLLHQQRET
ncbi:hypothetical protein FRC06_010628 [Ceratobasidium sp. 370]|nr:hypothetical protein FRC06_010628 [Ceratobasidium sp. 370]